MNKRMISIVGMAILVVVLAVAYRAYSISVEEDFKDISRVETYRLGDHYTGQYHRPTCPKLKQTFGEAIRFENAAAAREEGYSACKRCDPDGPDESEK